MRRVQTEALRLIREQGYGAVTVEAVARAANVGVASIFRNFGNKEQLVLWDEYDPMLLDGLGRALDEGRAPVDAVMEALSESLGAIYARDKRRILERADLVATTPPLAHAARLGVYALREGLDAALAHRVVHRLERAVLVASFAATLEVAVEEWRRQRARVPLERVLREAFAALRTGRARGPDQRPAKSSRSVSGGE